MTGISTVRSRSTKRVAVIAAALAATSALMGGTASAHHLKDHEAERRHIKDRARSVVGSPYSYGGTSPRGFDCSGFTRWTYLDHGANLPHSSMDQFNLGKARGYRRIWNRSQLQKGDLVFHKTTSARVGHVGIYIGKGKFISATSSEGVRVRSLYDPYYWGPRWVGATRLPATINERYYN
jgi:cell wall-associated NlpC family hydrolase